MESDVVEVLSFSSSVLLGETFVVQFAGCEPQEATDLHPQVLEGEVDSFVQHLIACSRVMMAGVWMRLELEK